MATHLAVLPAEVLDANIRFWRLTHPRTGLLCLFLPSGQSSILELQSISPDSSRSWFLPNNQIISDGKLLLMTPIDPAFLLVPILQAALPLDGSPGQFRPCYDIFEDASIKLGIPSENPKASPSPNRDILALLDLECVQHALKRICDYKELADDLIVYRFSLSKFLEMLQRKVERLAKPDGIFESSRILFRGLAKDGLAPPSGPVEDYAPVVKEEGSSLPSNIAPDSMVNDSVLPPKSISPSHVSEELRQSGRIKSSINLISQYLSPEITAQLTQLYDLSKLEAYLEDLHCESLAATAAATSTAKKPLFRKKSSASVVGNEEKKRKATVQSSKGVDKLKKANTTGMAKISSFFTKSK